MCSCNDKVSRCHVGERQESLGSMNDPFLGDGGRVGGEDKNGRRCTFTQSTSQSRLAQK